MGLWRLRAAGPCGQRWLRLEQKEPLSQYLLSVRTQKDEMNPRRIALFAQATQRVTKIEAGSTFSLAVSIHNQVFFWGQQGVRCCWEERSRWDGMLMVVHTFLF